MDMDAEPANGGLVSVGIGSVSGVMIRDPLEVAATTILKNDHGSSGAWPASCSGSCADGFERKEPSCKGCDNDFLMRCAHHKTPAGRGWAHGV